MTLRTLRTVKSAERILALFEHFSREQQPFTVGQISAELHIPQASVSMLLRNLHDLGYLEYYPDSRTFAPSIRVAMLGSWVGRRFSEASALAGRLDELQKRMGLMAYLAVQNGTFMQYIAILRPENPDSLHIDSGQFRPLTVTAPGQILLSMKPDPQIASWVRRCNAEATEKRFTVAIGDFMRLMTKVRAQGYAETMDAVTVGVGAIAVTFTPPMGRIPLVVGVGGPGPKVIEKRAEIIAALMDFKAQTALAANSNGFASPEIATGVRRYGQGFEV